jgi:SNARE protein 1
LPQNNETWRLQKYIEALDDMISELRTGPNQPNRDTLMEYARRIEFLKGVLQTSNLPSLSEKVVAVQLIKPGACSFPGAESRETEIKHRHTSKYTDELRRELLGESQTESKPNAGKGDLDDLLKYHHTIQEKIADHMLDLTKSLKEQVFLAGQIVKRDTEVLEKSSRTVDLNQSNLKSATETLETFNKRACKCWIWFLLVLVCSVFIGMVLFMRLFKKRVVPS